MLLTSIPQLQTPLDEDEDLSEGGFGSSTRKTTKSLLTSYAAASSMGTSRLSNIKSAFSVRFKYICFSLSMSHLMISLLQSTNKKVYTDENKPNISSFNKVLCLIPLA